MEISVIAPGCVEATRPATGRAAGLAEAAEAFITGGLLEELPALGVEVIGVERPVLEEIWVVSDDPIVNLGRYNELIGWAAARALRSGARPLLVGGTCNHLIGMLAGIQSVYGADARIGLVWFDAHGDFNTPRTTRSGMLGGMPVATAAGLCHGTWRDLARQEAPLPTDRIVFVDVRNLDPEEAVLIDATEATIARFGPGGAIDQIQAAVTALAERVDHIYLHIDADILDRAYQPNHPTAEPGGPGIAETIAAIECVMATHWVTAFGLVSVNPQGPDGATSLASGRALLRAGVAAWAAAWPGV